MSTKYTSEIITRFNKKIAHTPDKNECWEWQAGKSKNGYGQSFINGKSISAHRVAYELANGAIPDGLFVLHTCDNKACCNPAHLFLGTGLDNVRDKVSKGRQAKGETQGSAKLTAKQVHEIRSCYVYKSRDNSLRVLAKDFNVGTSQIRRIIKNQKWTHIGDT